MPAERLVISSPDAASQYLGVALGPSDWVEVGQDRIDAFAELTGDRQWIHTDPERAARESPWKGTIAHGYLSLALVPDLLSSVVTVRRCSTAVNTGIERLRFSAPVPAGSRVRLRGEIKDVREFPAGGVRVAFAVRLEVEGADKPALIATVNYAYFS